MSVTYRDLHHSRRASLNITGMLESLRSPLSLLALILGVVALYMLLSTLVAWGSVKLDDLRYGTPRTFHLTADVGHSEVTGMPSHLIAMNLDRQVVVLDIPGGDTSQIRTLQGPYLFGENEHLTPVLLRLQDVNADNMDDLIVQVKDEEIVYLNRDGSFALINAEERKQILGLGYEQ